jgi:ribonuclease T2
MKKLWLAAALGLLMVVPVAAQVPMQGSFVASKACPALQSIKKGTNPGNVMVAVGGRYRLLGKNKEPASHYWIEVPGAGPLQRWVAVDCGNPDGTVTVAPAPPVSVPAAPAGGEQATANMPAGKGDGLPFFVLSLSWEPAFCEAMRDKAECQAQTASSYDASHFALHGLWPQPRRIMFCHVDEALIAADDAHRWQDLPAPEMSAATSVALARVMPGTQSLLERHEWIKHGTCYPGGNADRYFADAVRLIDDVNASPVQAFVAAHVGETIRTADLRARFDEAYGAGAGERVRVACKPDGNRQLIVEVTVGLKGDVSSGTPLRDLIAASSPTDAGCPAGVIDPAGWQ